MVNPSIVVKIRRPTEDFNGSDSDFEVVSDSGNDNDSVIENGYERLNEELTDAVTLHTRPSEHPHPEESTNSDQECQIQDPEEGSTSDQKIVVNLTPKQITGDHESRLESRENRVKKSLSLVMLPKEMTLMNVAVPSSDETPENFISRSVSSNFVDRLNTALMRRNALCEETLKESLSNTKLSEAMQTPIPAVRKLSDSAVVNYSKSLQVTPEPLRKNSMPNVLPSANHTENANIKNVLNEDQTRSTQDSKVSSSSRWSFYKEVTRSAVDKIRDE